MVLISERARECHRTLSEVCITVRQLDDSESDGGSELSGEKEKDVSFSEMVAKLRHTSANGTIIEN
jgi:hypothetical protein